jgi:ABC-type sugar transport system permease subunit
MLEAAFVFAPLLLSAYYSVHRVRYFELGSFVWLRNYVEVLSSPVFLNSLLATGLFTVFALAFTFCFGFFLAIFLGPERPVNVALRTIILVPYVIMLVGSMLLKWLFSQDAGLLQLANAWLGLGIQTILADPTYAMAALVANGIWRDSAFAMVMLMAGLKSIPPSLIDAARIDGAGYWMVMRRIVLPLLKPAITITLVRLALHFGNVLTFPLILTGGGPNNATDTLALRIFRVGFEDYDLGRANAMALLLFLANVILVAGLLALFRKKESLP